MTAPSAPAARPAHAPPQPPPIPHVASDSEPRAVLRIPLWIDLRHVPVNKRLGLLHAVDEMAAEHVLLDKGDPHVEREALRPIVVDGQNHLKDGKRTIGRLVKVRDARSQARATEADGVVLVEADDWKVIPLENLVAARADRPGTLFALARTPKEAELFANILETGVHGVVLAPEGPADIFAADTLLRAAFKPGRSARPPTVHEVAAEARRTRDQQPASPLQRVEAPEAGIAGTDVPQGASKGSSRSKPASAAQPAGGHLGLQPARVTRIADGGMGDRVCVDCTGFFEEGEGLLVGSTARSFVLVHAETPTSDFVAPRPFRVNAGAVHSYLLGADGRTRYLSELRAGDDVLAVAAPMGATRTLTVGRSKVERRPHTLVHWRAPDGEANAMLQTAETVRLMRPDGRLVAVTDLRVGDEVLVHGESAARHFGMPVAESLEER